MQFDIFLQILSADYSTEDNNSNVKTCMTFFTVSDILPVHACLCRCLHMGGGELAVPLLTNALNYLFKIILPKYVRIYCYNFYLRLFYLRSTDNF